MSNICDKLDCGNGIRGAIAAGLRLGLVSSDDFQTGREEIK